MVAVAPATLNAERHIKYWKRCHDTYLPAAYLSNDSMRLTLACFIVSSLDLLRSPPSSSSPTERAAARAWVLSLQHPDGGFCGSATHAPVSGGARGTANLAATFFALILLALMADGDGTNAFAGVRRRSLLRWLRRLQRTEDGAVGQLLWQGKPVGGHDVRNGYMAAGIRWMLRGDVRRDGDGAWVEDLDVERLVGFIAQTQTHDGGMGETTSHHESHGGYTYCALAALRLLRRQPCCLPFSETTAADNDSIDMLDEERLLKFLAHRQFIYHAAEEEAERNEGLEDNFVDKNLEQLQLDDDSNAPTLVGCNGRWNKKADTCYFWWAGGALALLNKSSMLRREPARNFLTGITQHPIGGFAKTTASDPPDIYHSYLGLAALAAMDGSEGGGELKAVDAALCCSADAVTRIVRARDGLIEAERARMRVAANWETDGFW